METAPTQSEDPKVLKRREYIRLYQRQYRELHRGDGTREAVSRRYYLKHREKIRAYQKQYRLSHLDAYRIKDREYNAANPERTRSHNAKNSAKLKADPILRAAQRIRVNDWYSRNKEKAKADHAEWRKKNPGHWRALRQKRRALEKHATINLTSITRWMKSVRGNRTFKCYYCDARVSTNDIHFDHIVPLSKGGEHSVTNLCVSCITCNLRKSANQISAWVRIGQQVLSL